MSQHTATRNVRVIVRTLRIVTGLILLAFVTTHLLNASLGLISLEAMEAANPFLTGFWGAPPLGMALFLSLFVHFAIGLWSIYERPSLRTNTQDMVQIGTALLVVPVMATHVLGIVMAGNAGVHFDYSDTIRLMWIDAPSIGLLQIIVVTVVWLHGCAGLLVWLRSMERARNIVLWIYPIAIAIPVLSLLGFSEAGRDVLDAAANANAADTTIQPADGENPVQQLDFAMITLVTNSVIWGSLGLAALTLIARAIRLRLQTTGKFTLNRDDHELAPANAGLSMLDAFQEQNQPHASLCQGRGRCGTCAVRILSSEFPVPEPTDLERLTLAKKNLPADARLACQLKPAGGHLKVAALYPADYTYQVLDEDPITPIAEAAS